MPQTNIKLDLHRNLNFTRNFQINAVRKTNVRSKLEFHQILAERNKVSPQDLGTVGKRVSLQAQRGKSVQQRFFDVFG